MPVASLTLQAREETPTIKRDSSLSSFSCTGDHKNDARCEKPSVNNALEIGLGVGIPVFAILCVMAYFMVKNYRKEKKESMEHDPDFDENGDATALPDFPAFSKEDPFRNENHIKMMGVNGGFNGSFPLMNQPNKSATDLGSISSPMRGDENLHVDVFVLPHQNQIGSKASLHEFVRGLTDMRNFHQRRDLAYLAFTGAMLTGKTSPIKSSLKQGDPNTRPDSFGPRALGGAPSPAAYTQLPNKSTGLLGNDGFYHAKDTSDGSADTSKSSRSDDQFGVQYENELLKMAINSTLPSSRRSFTLSTHLKSDADDDADANFDSALESVEDDDDDDDDDDDSSVNFHGKRANNAHTDGNFHVLSPFEDRQGLPRRVVVPGTENKQNHSPENDSEDDHPRVKEPRLSQFDLLQNVSDDEKDTSLTESKTGVVDDQEEQLARMKSVYEVYFDRSNSMASRKTGDPNSPFHADESQPLPSLDVDHLKINSELKGDTSYDKRKTVTSSIYEEGVAEEIVDSNMIHPYQQFNIPSHPYQHHQPYTHPSPQQPQQQQYIPANRDKMQPPPLSAEDIVPLKSLPHASDIRNSTLETYTLYQPSSKVSSPSLRQQQGGHFDGESVSPYMSQASFTTANTSKVPHYGELPPVIRENGVTNNGTTPSPSQLSRTSVVMLNPVSEITSLRKFKPAGSLPSGVVSPNLGYTADDLATGDDLVPGNRKSAVRRMMNSNF